MQLPSGAGLCEPHVAAEFTVLLLYAGHLKGLSICPGGLYRPLGKAQHMRVHICVKLVLSVRTSDLAFLLVTAFGLASTVLPHKGEGEDAAATDQGGDQQYSAMDRPSVSRQVIYYPCSSVCTAVKGHS